MIINGRRKYKNEEECSREKKGGKRKTRKIYEGGHHYTYALLFEWSV